MKTFKLFDIETPERPPPKEEIQAEAAPLPAEKDTKDTQYTRNIYNPIASQREAEAQHRAVYAAHQDAIRKAGLNREDISKGILSGESPYNLLLKAIECISLMTGETLFYSYNMEQIKSIYGAGLLEARPLELELKEVQERLKMLTRPELQNEPADSRARINQAIKSHRQRETHLKELLEQ